MTTLRRTQDLSQKNAKIQKVFEEYLTRLGLRQTKQRRIIVYAVLASGRHVDVETIVHEVKKIDRAIGLATVYRTLKMMTEAHILVERHFGSQRTIFEFADAFSEHHDHLICNQCGEIVEFFDEEVERQQVKIALQLGFQLKDHKMELFADCLSPETCKRRAK